MCSCCPTSEQAECHSCRRWMLAWSHRNDLTLIARRRLRCPEDAADAVHEAMLRAVEYEHLDEDRIGAWMTRVLVNLCADQGRDQAREPKRRRYTVMIEMSDPSPEEVVIEKTTAAAACARLADMPKSQRDAILLRASGLPVGEVASRLGVGYKAAESLLSRGRAVVRAALVAGVAAVFPAARVARRLPAPAAAVALATVAAAVWIPAPSPGPAASGRTTAMPISMPDPPRVAASGAAPAPRAGENVLGVGVAEAREKRPTPSAPGRATEVLVAPVQVGAEGMNVAAGGASGTQHAGAWHEQAVQCLLDGPEVTLEYVGCRSSQPQAGDTSKDTAPSP